MYHPRVYNTTIQVRKKDGKRMFSCTNDLNSQTDMTVMNKDFECLKISILNKASQVGGVCRKVTIGPKAALHKDNEDIENNSDESNVIKNVPLDNGDISTRTSIIFSKKKILLENEIQRRESVQKTIRVKKQDMEKSTSEMLKNMDSLKGTIMLQKQKAKAERLARLEAEDEMMTQQMEEQNRNEHQMRRFRESQEIFQQILPFKESFSAKIRNIPSITKNCRHKDSASTVLNNHAVKLKDLNMQMEKIMERSKVGELTKTDVTMAEILVECCDDVLQAVKDDIDSIDTIYDQEIARREMEVKKAQLELQAQKEEAARVQQMQMQQQAPQVVLSIPRPQEANVNTESNQVDSVSSESQAPETEQQPSNSTSNQLKTSTGEQKVDYPDIESLQIYLSSVQFLENYSLKYQEFITSSTTKKFKFECQKAVSIVLNTITNLAVGSQLNEKYESLRLLLLGKATPNILQHPQAEAFCKNCIALKFLEQGETSISIKPESAFIFAALALALWNDFPDFGAVLLAQFRSKSPFFAPVFFTLKQGGPDQAYRKLLGYKFNDDGVPENPDIFLRRLSGLMYLYSSIMVTKQKKGVTNPHPHSLAHGWRWLAATLNFEPTREIADICATLLCNFLEVTGNDLWKTYPKQFPKILMFMSSEYYPKLKAVNPEGSGPISRLGDFLNNAVTQKSIHSPKGKLPPNFW